MCLFIDEYTFICASYEMSKFFGWQDVVGPLFKVFENQISYLGLTSWICVCLEISILILIKY